MSVELKYGAKWEVRLPCLPSPHAATVYYAVTFGSINISHHYLHIISIYLLPTSCDLFVICVLVCKIS